MKHCKECGNAERNKGGVLTNPIALVRRVAVYAMNKTGRFLPTGEKRIEYICEHCLKYVGLR